MDGFGWNCVYAGFGYLLIGCRNAVTTDNKAKNWAGSPPVAVWRKAPLRNAGANIERAYELPAAHCCPSAKSDKIGYRGCAPVKGRFALQAHEFSPCRASGRRRPVFAAARARPALACVTVARDLYCISRPGQSFAGWRRWRGTTRSRVPPRRLSLPAAVRRPRIRHEYANDTAPAIRVFGGSFADGGGGGTAGQATQPSAKAMPPSPNTTRIPECRRRLFAYSGCSFADGGAGQRRRGRTAGGGRRRNYSPKSCARCKNTWSAHPLFSGRVAPCHSLSPTSPETT